MDKYKCSKCGACCRHLDKSIYYAELDDGTGVCIHLNRETSLCTIYDERPLLCNIDESYDRYFKNLMTRDEYYEQNYKACEALR